MSTVQPLKYNADYKPVHLPVAMGDFESPTPDDVI